MRMRQRSSAIANAERAALQLLEASDHVGDWDDLRRRILDLTEGRGSLVAWRASPGARPPAQRMAMRQHLSAAYAFDSHDRSDAPPRPLPPASSEGRELVTSRATHRNEDAPASLDGRGDI